MSYINTQGYLILMLFSAVAMSVTLHERLGSINIHEAWEQKKSPEKLYSYFLTDLTVNNKT